MKQSFNLPKKSKLVILAKENMVLLIIMFYNAKPTFLVKGKNESRVSWIGFAPFIYPILSNHWNYRMKIHFNHDDLNKFSFEYSVNI